MKQNTEHGPARTQCPFFTGDLDKCGIRYSTTRMDKGLQSTVCRTDKHRQCKFFKIQSAKKRLTVLVVEDHYHAHENLAKKLSETFNCDVVLTAEKALRAYMLSLKNKAYYDAVLINVQIPAMDGVEVINAIRGFESNTLGIKKGVPIVLILDEEEIDVDVRFTERLSCVKKTQDIPALLGTLSNLLDVSMQ